MYNNLGVLKKKEISSFKRGLISAKLGENKNKLFNWLGIKSYREIDFKQIDIPDSKIAALAIEEANDLYSPSLLKHCYRTYFFSAGLAISQNLKTDIEFLFTTSILHDIGLTDKHNHACSQQCFAIYGGDFIKEFALKNGIDELKATKMQTAIDMHLNPYVNRKKFGNEAYLLSKGAAMDVVGAHTFQLNHNFIHKVHQEFPRTHFKEDILNTMTLLNHKENTRANILFKMGFKKLAANNKLNSVFK